MALSEELIKTAFTEAKTSMPNEALTSAVIELGKFDWKDILSATTPESRRAHEEINALITKEKFRSQVNTQWLASVLLVTNNYFKLACSDDRQAAVLFLTLGSYLFVNTGYFIEFNHCTEEQKHFVKMHILSLLDGATLSIVVKEGASDYELKLKQEHDKGAVEYNIKKTYDLIIALEHGRGFRSHFIIHYLIDSLIEIDLSTFVQRLNSIEKPDKIVFYLQELNDHRYQQLASTNLITNPWVNFEIIRGVIGDFRQKEITEELVVTLTICLNQLYKFSFDFYKQSILFFHTKLLFNQALGRQLKNIKQEDISIIFSRVLPVDTYHLYKDARNLLFEEIITNTDDQTGNEILHVAHQRWVAMYQLIHQSPGKYLNELLLTDFCDYVLRYLNKNSDEELMNFLTIALNKIAWIESEWVRTESQQITRFHLYLTEVYLLSEVIGSRVLTCSKVIQDIIPKLKNKAYKYERNVNEELFNRIEQNIGFV